MDVEINSERIATEHKDLIHDVSFDYYGRRMATCSSDQHVKIFDLIDGLWKLSASFKTHNGSVWRVTWSHPEFGQVIATCSFDRTATIWEEIPSDHQGDTFKTQWVRRYNIVDSRTSINDIKFSPYHLGLKLAICSADGIMRIYEAQDIMSLNTFTIQHEQLCQKPLSCLSWNDARGTEGMIAVGSHDPVNAQDGKGSSGGRVIIFELIERLNRKWEKVETLNMVTDPVQDVSFAPSMGRSFYRLAVASKQLYIFWLKPFKSRSQLNENEKMTYDVKQEQIAFDNATKVPMWRLSWNVTGTTLATSGDDSRVMIWRENYFGKWRCEKIIKARGLGLYMEPQKLTDTSTMGPAAVRSSQLEKTTFLPSSSTSSTAKFTKSGVMSNPADAPWH